MTEHPRFFDPSLPLRQQVETFESADGVSSPPKAAQTIITGAAYLSRGRVYTGQTDGETIRDEYGRKFSLIGFADLTLLYAPGDEVDNSGWCIESPRTRRLDIEITHRESLDV